MASADRISVHQHVVPPFWAEQLSAHGGDPSGWHSPAWSPDAAKAFMDGQEIAVGVLSLTAPSVQGWTDAERRDMARRVNEYTADLVVTGGGRFGRPEEIAAAAAYLASPEASYTNGENLTVDGGSNA